METWTKILILVMAGLNGLVLLLNAGLKSYIEKRAKNLATKDDLKDLVKEVKERRSRVKKARLRRLALSSMKLSGRTIEL